MGHNEKKWRPQACNFIKKEILAQVFSCEFCDISKNTFFIEHLQATASARTSKTSFDYLQLSEFYSLSFWEL